MSSRKIMQTFMQTSAPTVATVPFYNTAEDIQKTIGFRTGTHTCSLVVRAQSLLNYGTQQASCTASAAEVGQPPLHLRPAHL